MPDGPKTMPGMISKRSGRRGRIEVGRVRPYACPVITPVGLIC